MKKIYFLIVFSFLFISFIAQIPTASLTGYWPFTGNANDMSGNGNNGTVSGATLTADRFGNPNMAYSFDGVSNKITVNNASSIDMNNTTDFSIAFWIKTYNGPVAGGMPISKNTSGNNDSYQFFTNNTNSGYCTTTGQISFFAAPPAQGDACANSAVCSGTNLNTWFFITGVYDATLNQAKIYVNGVLQTDIGLRTGTLSSTNNLMFGCQPGNLFFYKGAIDDIRIYKTILTQSQITALYNECNTAVPADATNNTLAVNQTVCVNNTTTLSATSPSANINWFSSPSSTVVIATGTNFITPTLTVGSYTYYAEATSCTVSANRTAITLTVLACTGLSKNAINDIKLDLYPNPNDGNFIIDIQGNASYVVTNILGQFILKENLAPGKNKIDLTKNPNGTYFIRVTQNNFIKTIKFIKNE